MGDIDEAKLQAAIDALHASATTFSNASHTVQSRAQHLFGISLDITYNVHDWAGAGSEAFQHAWGQFDQDSRKAVNALSGTANALNKLAQKLQDALDAKRQAALTQGLMIVGTIGLGILDVLQLGLDPVTDAATVGMGAGAVAEGAVDIAGMVAEADAAASAEIAGIETTEVGTLETVDEGALDGEIDASEEIPSESGGGEDPVDVYRVQGGASKERLSVTSDGNITIQGKDTLFLNFNQEQRALDFLARRGDSAYIVRFQVKNDFLEFLRNVGVDERVAKLFPERPIKVDTEFPDQFGIRSNLFDELLEHTIPGSAKVIRP